MADIIRWHSTWTGLGVDRPDDQLFAEVMRRYVEPHRSYHTATKHDASPSTNDAALLVDVDLAILGAPAERFDEYEQQVREEYSWVPGFLFRRKRREILEAFLRRPTLYSTEHFRTRYEAAARANLSRSIHQLGR